MDFSLPVVFVVPSTNTLPTSGSTESLTDGQFGVVKDISETAVTAGTIGSASYIKIVQGRPTSRLGTKKSDKIAASKVKKWYKITGSATAANEIWELSGFTGKCDQSLTLTLRGHSSYLDTISFNGFTRSLTIQTPCCDCGADPCETVTNEQIIDLFMAKLAQIDAVQNEPVSTNLTTFFTFIKVGTGSNAVIRIESKPITKYGQFCDVSLNPWEYDRVWFRVWAYANPDTSIDFLAYDRCEQIATATEIQRSSYPKGDSNMAYRDEIDYYSYQAGFKDLFTEAAYNQQFVSFAEDGVTYDQYVLYFNQLQQDDDWSHTIGQDEEVIIWAPQGSVSSGIQTLLAAYLGQPTNESGALITTTTTSTTTSSSTSSSTTTLIP